MLTAVFPDIEEQKEAVRKQKVADLLEKRRREREAASAPPPTQTTSHDAPPSHDPASQLCTA